MDKGKTRLEVLKEKVRNIEAREAKKAEKENIRQEINALKKKLKG